MESVFIIEGEMGNGNDSVNWIEGVYSTRELSEERCLILNATKAPDQTGISYSYEEYRVNTSTVTNLIPEPHAGISGNMLVSGE